MASAAPSTSRACSTASPGRSSDFEGMQAQYEHSPATSSRSTIATRMPPSARSPARRPRPPGRACDHHCVVSLRYRAPLPCRLLNTITPCPWSSTGAPPGAPRDRRRGARRARDRRAPAGAASRPLPARDAAAAVAPRLADRLDLVGADVRGDGYGNRSCMMWLPYNRPAVENGVDDSAANTYLTSARCCRRARRHRQQLDPGPGSQATYDWWARAPAPRRRRATCSRASTR